MAKYRHRTFEMYDFREEAVLALTPKPARNEPDANFPETGSFQYLVVSPYLGIVLVQFQSAATWSVENASQLRDEFGRLAELLIQHSRVVLDFGGVESFDAAAIQALMQFHRKLQTKGSRIALCALAPNVRESFFDVSASPR